MNIRSKTDKTISGFLLGVIIPAAALLVLYMVTARGISLASYLTDLFISDRLTMILTLSVIPVVILFFVFNRLDMLKGARGILGATILWVLLIAVDRII